MSASDVANDTICDNVVSVDSSVKNVNKEVNIDNDKLSESNTDYYVSSTTGSDSNNGTSGSPFKTIQTALNKTTSTGTYNIYLSEGTYKGIGNTNLTINGNSTINIIGAGINRTVIDGEASYTIGSASVWGQDEYWDYYLYNSGNWGLTITEGTGLITIQNLNIQNMISPGGSSISAYRHATVDNYGNLNMDSVYFRENLAGIGAGIRSNNGATLYVNNSIFEKNRKANSTGNYGAGIYNNGTAVIENSQFIRNAARWGTITNDKNLTIRNSIIRDGISYDLSSEYKTGSGISIDTGSSNYYESFNNTGINTIIDNCTFINNSQLSLYQGYVGNLVVNNSLFNATTGIFFENRSSTSNGLYSSIIENTVLNNITRSSLYGNLASNTTTALVFSHLRPHNLTIINSTISMPNNSNWGLLSYYNTKLINNNISVKINLTINNSVIEENTINNIISINGTNNNITKNNITSNESYAIYIYGSNNTIKENNIESPVLKGSTAVYRMQENNIENNTPETAPDIITETTYNNFFDTNGYLLDSIDSNILYIAGTIQNKKFIFNKDKNITIQGYKDSVLVDSVIEIHEPAKISLQNITMNTTNNNLTYQLLINSTNNIVNFSNFHANTNGKMQSIIINKDNNRLNRITINNTAISNNINYTNNYGVADTIGMLITSSNNNLTNLTVNVTAGRNNGTYGTITGISIQSPDNTANNNTIENMTLIIKGDQYTYGLKLLNTHNNTITSTNRNNLNNITVSSNNYATAIQLAGNITNNNIITPSISGYVDHIYRNKAYVNASIGYAVLVDGYVQAENNTIYLDTKINKTNNIYGAYINQAKNTLLNISVNGSNITDETPNELTGVYINNSTNGTLILLVNTTYAPVNSTGLIINNSQDINVEQTIIRINITNGIKILNSKNINIHNNNIQTINNTIILNNTNDTIIKDNYLLKNNETGSNASINMTNTNNITLDNNSPEIITLTDNNYNDYFTNQIFKLNYTTIIQLGSNLYNKNLTFTSNVTIYGNNYTIYNGTVTLNGTNSSLYSVNFNSTDNHETLIQVAPRMNGTIYYSNIYHNTTSLIRTMINGNLEYSNITVFGVEKETTDNSPSILVFNNTYITSSNINATSTGNTGYMVILNNGTARVFNLTATGNNITAIIESTIQTSRTNTMDVYGKTYANGVLNGSFSSSKIFVRSDNIAIGIINGTQSSYSNVTVYSNNTGAIMLGMIKMSPMTTGINFTGTNVDGLIFEDMTQFVTISTTYIKINKTLNKNFTALKIINHQAGISIGGGSIVSDGVAVLVNNFTGASARLTNIRINTSDVAIIVENVTTPRTMGITITGCTIVTNNTGESIVINNADVAQVSGNYITSNNLRGNNATNITNTTRTTISNNRPGIIITTDNYDEHFTEGVYNFDNETNIELGSDLYNKTFIFNELINITNPNNYTIYNGIFKFSKYSRLYDVNLDYVGNDTIIINGTRVDFTNGNINIIGNDLILINGTQVNFTNGSIKVTGNNNILLRGNFTPTFSAISVINNINMSLTGNNITLMELINGRLNFTKNNLNLNINNSTLLKLNSSATFVSPVDYNNIYINGDDNVILIRNAMGTVTGNNITVNTTTPTTLIVLNNGTSMLNNSILINTAYGDTPVVYTKTTQVRDNYIQTLDTSGDNTIQVDGNATVSNNTNYKSQMNASIPNIILNDTISYINVSIVDIWNNTVNDGKIYLYSLNQTNVETINNGTAHIPFTPTELGEQNITITLVSDKYTADNITATINVLKLNTTINATPIKGYVNENLTLTVTITDSNGNKVTKGNVYFIDDNSSVKTATVNNGTATLTGLNTTYTGKMIIRYSGTGGYYASNATTNITITKHNTTITVDNVRGIVGESITLIARIVDESGNNVTSGRVQFKINGVTLRDTNGSVIYVNVTRGVARLTLTAVRGWTNTNAYISANYAGNSVYLTSTSNNSSVSIAKRNATVEIINDIRVYKAGDTITITAVVTDSNGQLANSGQVVFKLNGVTLKDRNGKTIMVNVVNGIATLTYTLPSTFADYNYTITAIFAGGDYNRQVSKNSTLQVIKTSIHMDLDPVITTTNTATIRAKIYDGDNKQITGTTRVTIKLNGVTIINSQNITNGNLQFTINTPYKTGLYNMTIIAGPSSVYEQLQRNTTLVIMKN